MKDDAELYHSELVEKILSFDDDLMMQYLEGEEPTVDEMKKVLRKATCEVIPKFRYAAVQHTETRATETP